MNQAPASTSSAGRTPQTPSIVPSVKEDSPRKASPCPPENQHESSESSLRLGSAHRSRSPSLQTSKMVRGQGKGIGEKTDRPTLASSSSAPSVPQQLLQNSAQYSDAYVPSAAITSSTTTLAELAHLVRLESYQAQRRARSRVRLHRWLVSSALSARLARCGELAHRTLVDNFRSDDAKSFTTLYNAIHDVRNSCDATRQYALLEPDLTYAKSKPRPEKKSFTTFINDLPQPTRESIIGFLVEIRTNPQFLANRIANLSSSELSALTSFHHSLDPIETVMPGQAKNKGLGASMKHQHNTPNAVERLLSFQRHDPLSALLYTVFANSAGPDSAEDLRRTDVWSTTCARLITESKPGGEQFMIVVLNTWAAMREWPAKASLELYLMRVLQEGAFLLERGEDGPIGIRSQSESRNTKDTIATEDFYDKAVKQFFEVVDNEPSAGGIPEGVLELGNAIIKKLDDSKKIRAAQTFIVSRWFFSTFLLNAVIHPESQGMMTSHHITEYARQTILKEIAIRAQKNVLDMTYNLKQPKPILPEIRSHIEKILGRFRNHKSSNTKPVLLPAKAITSPRETIEVQPFLVVCPTDIVTLANTLFPERRPESKSLERGLHITGLQSAASSISGQSLPLQMQSSFRNDADSSSILSNSVSSITSDVTSREPLLELTDGHSTATSLSSLHNHARATTSSEEYAAEIRQAVSDMSRRLAMENINGSTHPCAEQWAVLYVSADGKSLMTRMRKDFDDEEEDEDESPDSDSEDEAPSDKIDLASEYHQLKESIIKLVEEYEIPKELAPESESKEFSNRASTVRKSTGKKHSFNPWSPANSQDLSRSNNPYYGHPSQSQNQSHLSALIASQQREAVPERRRAAHIRANSAQESKAPAQQERPSVLITMLETASNQCNARGQYIAAHTYHSTLRQLIRLSSESLKRDGFGPLLNYFSRGPRDSLGKSQSAIEEFEAWFVWLKQSQERHDATIEEMMLGLKALRDKMWYVTGVKNSGPYEAAKNVVLALKGMSSSTLSRPTPHARLRNGSKHSSTFLQKSESQTMELMAAPIDQGGPNKLVDEQAEMTLRYLTQYRVENFCKGEERIHRFCYEIDKLVTKITGNDMEDGPDLWSSDLYSRDKRILDSGRQKGDLHLTGVGTLSIAVDEEYETESSRTAVRSPDLGSRPSSQGLRSISARNASQQSFDSDRWSINRSSGRPDTADSRGFFAGTSPKLSIDTSHTFWSPFQKPEPASSSSILPRTASSTNDTVMLKNSDSVNRDKQKFLVDLKQTLTSLLLSDLGTLVWSQGSETDSWFSGDLGEECLQRRDEQEARERRRRKLAKKRSMKNLRPVRGDQPQPPEETSSSSDATARSSGLSAAKKGGLFDFPYNTAFRRLLHKFSTHPNPFTKLHALYELELLIIELLNSRSGKIVSRKDPVFAMPTPPRINSLSDILSTERGPQVTRAKDLDGAIANCQERRSYMMVHNGHSTPHKSPTGTRSPGSPPSTDMVVDVLRDLFRDAEIRPKGLFRDLQFVASFVPASILDKTECGKAFWDTGLAALSLKQDVCRTMIEMADEIQSYHTKRDEAMRQSKSRDEEANSQRIPKQEDDDLARFSMEDAARMWIITAKEGEPAAERELATFYLTHPDLLPRTTQPLSKPQHTFRSALKQRNEDPTRSDPATMCVAYHWMELSSQGGDDLARKYLRTREELNALPS